MIKTTEELKRAMYLNLPQARTVYGAEAFENALEAYLERLHNEATSNAARLEEAQKWSSICSDAYTHQQQLTHAACVSERETWSENHELKSRIAALVDSCDAGCHQILELREDRAKLCDERDLMRNRLQALEHANAAAGDELRKSNRLLAEAREDKKRMRQSIGQLKNDRNNAQSNEIRLRVTVAELRQSLRDARQTLPGTSAQSSEEKAVGEVLGAVQRLCQHSWRTVHAYPSFKEQLECIFCLKIEEA